jgi:hypothetical protein
MPSDRKTQRIWLEPSWLTWENHQMSSKPLDREKAKRAYEIHEHASNRLAHGATKLDRVDAITSLKRAVTQRVQVLKEAYELGWLSIPNKPKRDLELVAYLGIVRPLMLRRLIEIRNLLEHEDSDPPSSEDCEIFADFVWYFLRSTDVLAHRRLTRFTLVPQEHGHHVGLDGQEVRLNYYGSRQLVDPRPGSPTLNIIAYLPKTSIAYQSRPDWVEVQGTTSPDLRFIEGELIPGRQMKLIWTWYFSRPFEGPWIEYP